MLGTPVDISDLLHLPSRANQSSGAYYEHQPLASESAWFSDAFDYSIAVRRASRDWISSGIHNRRAGVSFHLQFQGTKPPTLVALK